MKRKDGGDYEPSSLRGFIASFNRHLKNVKYSKSIVEDREFEQTRKVLHGCSLQTPKKKKAGGTDHLQPRLSAMTKKAFFTRVTYRESRVPRL